MNFLEKQNNETFEEFQIRLCRNREEYELTWVELANILNEVSGESFSESKYRKWFYAFDAGCKYANMMSGKEEKQEIEPEIDNPIDVETELLKDGSQRSTLKIKMSKEQSKDSKYLLEVHGFDPDVWEIVNAKNSIWMQNSNKKGELDLYSSKITVKPRSAFDWNKENIERLFCEIKNEPYTDIKKSIYDEFGVCANPENEETLLFLPISDLHYGLYSTKELTGNEYNIEIAEKRFLRVIDNVIERVKDRNIDKIVFLMGNDCLNSDNINNTTTRGTPQDNHSTWFDIIRGFTTLMIDGIERLRRLEVKIHIIPIISNHDMHSAFGITQTLMAYYMRDNEVTFDDTASPRKYFKFGVNMIGIAHDAKMNDVPKLMSVEEPYLWAETRYRIFFLSHLHRESVVEDKFGVDVRRLPTISGKSKWTNDQGYFSQLKNQAFIFSSLNGLTDILNTNIV